MVEISEENVSQLIILFIRAKKWHERLNNYLIPTIQPHDIYKVCDVGSKLLYDLKKYAPHLIPDDTPNFSISFPDNFENPSAEFRSTGGDYLTALNIWGQALDLTDGPIDFGLTFSDHWEKELTDFVVTENGKTSFKQYEIKDWYKILKEWDIQYFFECSRQIVYGIIEELAQELEQVDVGQHPHAKLALALYDLKGFRDEFISDAIVVGPYFPTKMNDFQTYDGQIDIDIASDEGILKVSVQPYNIKKCGSLCEFITDDSETIEWKIDWSLELSGLSLGDYEDTLFSTWSYATGEHIGLREAETKAYWLMTHTGVIANRAHYAIETIFPLLVNEQYKTLAERAIKVIMNDLPKWYPRKVQWSYIKELDEIIRDFEYTLRLDALKRNIGSWREDNLTDIKRTKNFQRIPSERKSAPLSLTRMANYWGGEMTPKKLKYMIKNQYIGAEQINRQTYVFDIEKLPDWVKEKVRK